MSTVAIHEVVAPPRNMLELREYLNLFPISDKAREYAILIGWMDSRLFTGRVRKNRLRPENWTAQECRQTIRELIDHGALYLSKNKSSVSFIIPKGDKPDSAKCVYCGCRATGTKLTVDHVVPLSRGGTNKKSNRVWACKTCNNFKSDRTPTEVALMFLEYHKRLKPIERLTWRQRLRLVVLTFTGFLGGLLR